MTVELYNRYYKLTIGIPGQENQARVYTDLTVDFTATKTNESNANELDFKIINLNKDSRNFITKKGMFAILEAGYTQESGVIFKGNLETPKHVLNGSDWESSFKIKDGISAIVSTPISKSFTTGVTLETIINELVNKMVSTHSEISKGIVTNIPNFVFNSGRSLYGNCKQQLDEIARSFNLKWFIQDNAVYVTANNKPTGTEVILLNASSGLIGRPEKLENGKGWRFTSLMRPGFNVGKRVKVESQEANGLFLQKKVIHAGNWKGQQWYTFIEAQQA